MYQLLNKILKPDKEFLPVVHNTKIATKSNKYKHI